MRPLAPRRGAPYITRHAAAAECCSTMNVRSPSTRPSSCSASSSASDAWSDGLDRSFHLATTLSSPARQVDNAFRCGFQTRMGEIAHVRIAPNFAVFSGTVTTRLCLTPTDQGTNCAVPWSRSIAQRRKAWID